MALIPKFFLDTVVAIGSEGKPGEYSWNATGFFYGSFTGEIEGGKKMYNVFLVSNQHVFEGLDAVVMRCNPRGDEGARVYALGLVKDGTPLWVAHPDPKVDVAIVSVKMTMLEEHGMEVDYFHSDETVATTTLMAEIGVTEGDMGYVLGFPMGNTGGDRNFVIVRNACIARIRDAIDGKSNDFLVDSFVFPGNSGGPVILRPEAISITGTKSQGRAYLLGVVKSYEPYLDIAISAQTKRPRVVFEENSGLAAVHPVDYIDETIQAYLEAEKTSEGQGAEDGDGEAEPEAS